jgi:hypothetical protein
MNKFSFKQSFKPNSLLEIPEQFKDRHNVVIEQIYGEHSFTISDDSCLEEVTFFLADLGTLITTLQEFQQCMENK